MKVYIVQSKKNLLVYGCFDSREKAIIYIDGNDAFHIIESSVL